MFANQEQEREIFQSHPRVQELQAIWERMKKDRESEGLTLPINDTSAYTPEDWRRSVEPAANTWAALEYGVLSGQRPETLEEITASIAFMLQGYRHNLAFIRAIALRVDHLLASAQPQQGIAQPESPDQT